MTHPTSPHFYTHGFSLVETLVTLSLLTACISIGLAESLDTLARASARTDRELLVSTLHEARLRSLNRVCSSQNCAMPFPHGVYLEHNQLTLFEGLTYASRTQSLDVRIPFSSEEIVCSSTNEIGFLPSGNATSSTTLSILGKDNRTEVVLVGIHGEILARTQT